MLPFLSQEILGHGAVSVNGFEDLFQRDIPARFSWIVPLPFLELVRFVYDIPIINIRVSVQNIVKNLDVGTRKLPDSRPIQQLQLVSDPTEVAIPLFLTYWRLALDQVIDTAQHRSMFHSHIAVRHNRASKTPNRLAVRDVQELQEPQIAHPSGWTLIQQDARRLNCSLKVQPHLHVSIIALAHPLLLSPRAKMLAT